MVYRKAVLSGVERAAVIAMFRKGYVQATEAGERIGISARQVMRDADMTSEQWQSVREVYSGLLFERRMRRLKRMQERLLSRNSNE